MLYILNFTQLALPLVTLPYLTRVLSVNSYGVVSYVKSIMAYATLIIEFGFMFSGVNDVVNAHDDKEKLGKILYRITLAKLILSIFSFIILIVMILTIPLLHKYPLFTILSFIPSFLSIFLFDYLFRGLEEMQIVTFRFLIAKSISTILTFIVIKNDNQLLLLPILDIIGSGVAVLWVQYEINRLNLKLKQDSLGNIFKAIQNSFTYFVSDLAGTVFVPLNTFFVGLILAPKDIAYWGVLTSILSAIQSLYSPISNGIYPRMIATKSLSLFLKIIFIFIPCLVGGSLITFFGADLIVSIIGGTKYIPAALYLKESIPQIVISFFSILCGWPLLGAINKIKENTLTTGIAAVTQVIGLTILIISKHFSLTTLIIIRTLAELTLPISRSLFAYKYKELFNK